MTYMIFELEMQPGVFSVEAWPDYALMSERKRMITGTKAECLAYLATVL